MANPKALASASSSPVQAGPFQNAIGIALSSGKLTLDLSQASAIGGGGELVPTRVTITLDANGFVSAGQVLWANDQITPSGTTYRMQAYDSTGNFVADFGFQSIIGTAPIDLSLLTPTSIGGGVSLPAVVVQNPSSTQWVNTFPLIMGNTSLGFSSAINGAGDAFLSRGGAGIIQLGSTAGGADGRLYVGNGLVGSPSLTFASDTSSGFYHIAASRIGLALGGANNVDFQSTITKFNAGPVSATTGFQVNSAATSNQALIGNGTNFVPTSLSLTSAQFANQGTTTTVLHGNAAGNPSFGSVSLTTDVSGSLPLGNQTAPTGTGFYHVTSGTADSASKLVNLTASTDVAANQGTTTTVLHGNAAGQASFGAVVLTTDVSGVLPTGNGGTAQNSTATFPTSGVVVTEAGTETLTNKTYGGTTLNQQVFAANGTFTIPANIKSVKVTLVGGGGAGGGATTTNNGGGGGSGGSAIKWLSGLTPANTIAVTVGGGGTGASGTTGGNGVASSIASGTQTITTVTANGGSGGNANGSQSAGGAGATVSTNGDANAAGTAGHDGIGVSGGPGGGSMFAGGAAGSNGGNPGISAIANTGGGGGGAGAGATRTGGNGGSGIVIFEWVN